MSRTIILMAIFVCLSLARGDTNNKWQPNDNLLRVMDDYYFDLVGNTHVYSQKQRYLSIITLALAYYMTNRENISNPQRVHDAVENTRAQLDRPTEVITTAMQALLRVLRIIVDKPINDVKQSCPPNVGQIACESSLKMIQAKNEEYCKGYMANVKHYNEVVDLFYDGQIPELTVEISTAKKTTDEDALRFFSSAANGKYSKLIKRMRDQFQRQNQTSYACNAFNVQAF